MRHHHYLLLVIYICCSLALTAQNKNALHASIFYPGVVGRPILFGTLKQPVGFNLGYQYYVSRNFSLGGNYAFSAHGCSYDNFLFCANGIEDLMVNISFHDFDARGSFCVNPFKKWRTIISMTLGYSHSIFTMLVEEHTNEMDGYNFTPSIELNRKISDHFSVYTLVGYSYKHFTFVRLHAIELGLGSEFSF